MNILDKIISHKKKYVLSKGKEIPVSQLQDHILYERKTISLKQRLSDSNSYGIIAEFKRKSPSKGIINSTANLIETTVGYQNAGASAISILTDNEFFGGKNEDLTTARPHLTIPILRKDFIVDQYQVHETKALGADIILLIATCLTVNQQVKLASLAKKIGLEVLLEIHSKEELAAEMIPYVDILGVNNRNLKTFETNIQNSLDMIDKLPEDVIKISESGISDLADIEKLSNAGFKGFLIGEQFMKYEKPSLELSKFLMK